MHTIWGCEDEEGWWDGAGMTRRVHRTDDPEEMGYMRGTWRSVGAVRAHPAMEGGGMRAVKWYGNMEALRQDKEVYKAVRAAIGAAHVGDGMTVWDIIKETEEQKRRGRIGYMVVAERKEQQGDGQGQTEGMRRGRDLEGRRTRRAENMGTGLVMGERGEEVRGGVRVEGNVPEGGRPAAEVVVAPAVNRGSLCEMAGVRMNRVRAAATELGLQLRDNLMRATREDLCRRERWGREPIEGGGWLVLFAHGQLGEGTDMWNGCEIEVRLAILQAQWGWGAFAVSKCTGGMNMGWYEGELLAGGAKEWDKLGRREGREHTLLAGYTDNAPYVNGIDGVAGMQYLNSAYGRRERERETGQPEPVEKIKMRPWGGKLTFAVKDKCSIKAGEEMRVAYGWTKAAWAKVKGGAEGTEEEGVVRGWMEGDRRGPMHQGWEMEGVGGTDGADVVYSHTALAEESGLAHERGEGVVIGPGGLKYYYRDWMDPDWEMPDTVEEVNRLWEEHRMVGRWRVGSVRGHGQLIGRRRMG